VSAEYEWDAIKARANLGKHGIDFADAVTVFEDPRGLTIEDAIDDEVRHVTLGMDAEGRLLVVVYTWRADVIRVISARRATRREVQEYEEGI
jgi:uncharacterized protein